MIVTEKLLCVVTEKEIQVLNQIVYTQKNEPGRRAYYRRHRVERDKGVIVPRDFKTSLASVPCLAKILIKLDTPELTAAIVYDYMTRKRKRLFKSRRDCAKSLKFCLRELGCGKVRSFVISLACLVYSCK